MLRALELPSKFENMAVREKSGDVESLEEEKKSSKNCSVDAMRH